MRRRASCTLRTLVGTKAISAVGDGHSSTACLNSDEVWGHTLCTLTRFHKSYLSRRRKCIILMKVFKVLERKLFNDSFLFSRVSFMFVCVVFVLHIFRRDGCRWIRFGCLLGANIWYIFTLCKSRSLCATIVTFGDLLCQILHVPLPDHAKELCFLGLVLCRLPVILDVIQKSILLLQGPRLKRKAICYALFRTPLSSSLPNWRNLIWDLRPGGLRDSVGCEKLGGD